MFGCSGILEATLVLLITAQAFLVGCGKVDSFSALEETNALLGENFKPILTKPKILPEIHTGESLALDFNNEKIGNDDGMKYSCLFDNVIDQSINGAQDCEKLPDLPEAKFDSGTGKFTWGPLATTGHYEFQISGTNIIGTDSQIFSLSVIENRLPSLAKIRDQRTDANRTLIIAAVNQNKTSDDSTIFTCYYDTKIDDSVESSVSCDTLPGEEKKKFDSKTGTMTWTPPNSAVGAYEIMISIRNKSGADKQFCRLPLM